MSGPRFGVFLSPHVEGLPQLTEKAQAAESTGFDYVSIQDHPYVPHYVDTFTLIAHLATTTSRIRLMTNVANLPLRPAPMLAKTSASIDLLSGGRFELGLGGGRAWDQIAGLGGPRWSPGETVAATSEAIDTIRALWTADRVLNVSDGHYPLIDAASGPPPAHRIGIWLGAAGPRMLNLLGAKADGWIAPLATAFDTKPAAQDRIDAAARAAGRQPTDIHRVIQLVGLIDGATASRPRTGRGNTPIHANAESWAQIITEFVTDERFDTINFVPQSESVDQVRHFGDDVIPRVRAALQDRQRDRPGAPPR
ncbi:LLM class flavin-dependent oxidoreductase [Amycolatopsis cynarae]|uniref:LLM class flavin-dependent oxidoreductase n=1 Tax=Amycolatopsis cynarae TaxID=2995223 RepID=A0ABY7B627_9PSEU|nr:LLM class flavin-dependent oxidoreductase [Amycolatopsis sp. HUAS 11-8]WAL67774.1 LLM class flavin-dependent oxidoreductase [Amycolatopsis sp. HUAS 11-8]